MLIPQCLRQYCKQSDIAIYDTPPIKQNIFLNFIPACEGHANWHKPCVHLLNRWNASRNNCIWIPYGKCVCNDTHRPSPSPLQNPLTNGALYPWKSDCRVSDRSLILKSTLTYCKAFQNVRSFHKEYVWSNWTCAGRGMNVQKYAVHNISQKKVELG